MLNFKDDKICCLTHLSWNNSFAATRRHFEFLLNFAAILGDFFFIFSFMDSILFKFRVNVLRFPGEKEIAKGKGNSKSKVEGKEPMA